MNLQVFLFQCYPNYPPNRKVLVSDLVSTEKEQKSTHQVSHNKLDVNRFNS
jgi:hypothetical protein